MAKYIFCYGLCGKKATTDKLDKKHKTEYSLCKKCKIVIENKTPEEIKKEIGENNVKK